MNTKFECTVCGLKLDKRKKANYLYASFALKSKGFMDNMFNKKYWVFCSNRCQIKANFDYGGGNFEKLYGEKYIDFKP